MSTTIPEQGTLAVPEVARTAANLRSVLRNALALLGAYALPRVLTFASIVVAARVLGAEQFGQYGAAASFAVILSVFASLGMTPLLTRDLARRPERATDLLRAAHVVKTVSGIVMLSLLYAVASYVLNFPPDVRTASLLLGVSYAIASYAENYSAYYQAVERMQVWTTASALFGLVTGVCGALLALRTRSVVWFSLAPVGGQLAALLYLRSRLPAAARRTAGSRVRELAPLLRDLAPFVAAFTALTIYYKVDVLVLNELGSRVQVGYYTAAYKFVDIVHALTIVATAAVYPRLARRSAAGIDGRWAGTRLVELVVLGVVPVAGMLWLARSAIINTLFGGEFAPAAPAIAFLAPALPALAVNIVAGYMLGLRGRMLYVAAAYAGAVVLNVGLNLGLAPQFGASGVAAAKLISETLLAGGLLIVLHHAAAAAPGRRTVVAGLAVALCCLSLELLSEPIHGWLRAAALVGLTWLIYVRFGVLASHERSALRSILDFRGRWAAATD